MKKLIAAIDRDVSYKSWHNCITHLINDAKAESTSSNDIHYS
jgi:hypothetical protein